MQEGAAGPTPRWGAVLPTGMLGELAGLSSGAAWRAVRDFAVAAEAVGYDHLWAQACPT